MLVPLLLRSYGPFGLWGFALLGLGYTSGWLLTRSRARRRASRDSQLALAQLREIATSVAADIEHAALSDRAGSVQIEPCTDETLRHALAEAAKANEQLQQQLKTAEEQLQRKTAEIEAQAAVARTDALTGLANRRAFDDELNRRYAE